MRKALMGLLITATAFAPMATAYAQSGGRDGARAERQQQRAQRQEQRSERRVQRAEQRAARTPAPQPRVQAAPQAAPQRADRNVARGGNVQLSDWQRRAPGAERARIDASRQAAQRTSERRSQGSRQWDGNRNDRSRRDGQWDGRNNGQWDGNRNGQTRRGQYNGNRNGQWDRGSSRRHNWNHNWRNDRRYDWQRFRNSNRSHFRAGRYYSPYRNHGYSRFSIGFFLEPLFYSSRYWINDPYQYRLPQAYPGTRWVRYYDDILLVDTYSGEVIDVIYDFFW